MSYKDLYTMTKPNNTVPSNIYNANVTGLTVDRRFNESAIAVLNWGDWTDGSHSFFLQESDDAITWANVATEDVQGVQGITFDGVAGENISAHLGYLGDKRYIRVNVTVTGATTGAYYSATIVQDYPRFSGASQLAE